MKKDLAIIAGLFLLIIVLLVFGGGYTSLGFGSNNAAPIGSTTTTGPAIVNVTAKTLNVEAEVARSTNERRKGLSKRDSLPFNQGMLFVFENKGQFGIWMKDMKFAIDIIWLDENKRIIDIARNVAPEPGKKDSELTIYKPSSDAAYVLEINAGLSELNGLQPGDQVNFEL